MSSHAPHGQTPLRTVQVLGGGSAGSGAHVRSLSAGLVARGVRVTVCAPAEVGESHTFDAVGARYVPVARRGDPASVAALRAECADADLVHAHGVNAGLRAALALRGLRVPLVVTWHARVHAQGPRAQVVRLMERRVARAASVVLGTCCDLVDRARRRGARDARLAAVAFPARDTDPAEEMSPEDREVVRGKARAELGAVGRPLLVAVGSLDAHRGYETLLDAAHTWLGLDPVPLLVIAGEGPLRGQLQRRIEAERLPVRLLGRRDDAPEILAGADAALLTSRWEARSPVAQEALRARVPLIASAVGGTPELVGDAASLVPYGDAGALGDAVARVLGDAAYGEALRDRGVVQAATWPTEDETVAQVLSVYDELTRPLVLR
ncbi:glycosyltransferase family 4 protein [Streptomyces uncialis]|uniref:glycosyltransferase family 4 protein n=1 Tax=Streptomyces uncialis TaxID=1048205 RepID=UPI003869838D|nr:glycosyltransferase family 4 protein [Streptomyces uncialis]